MAQPWLNFMDNYRGPHGGFGKQSWERASAFYSPSQIKTALQFQGQRGAPIGGQLQSEMQKHKGAAHGVNQFMGAHGNIGLTSYKAAKAAGHKPTDIYNQAAQHGMYLPKGANAQYQKDLQDEFLAEQEMLKKQWMEQFANQETPGSQTGMANVGSGYNALGVRTPTPAGHELNTGGTSDAFSRKKTKKTKKDTASPLAIQSITL